MITGSIISGFFVYSILSYLFVASRITVPIFIIVSILIFGLTKYYSTSDLNANQTRKDVTSIDNEQNDILTTERKRENTDLTSVTFVTIFSILIFILSSSNQEDFHIFINWGDIQGNDIIHLGSAIMLCFFIPGLGIVLIIFKNYRIDPILSVLLAYLFSILITGLTAYVSALSFDSVISESKNLFILVYVLILVGFLICYPTYKIRFPVKMNIVYYFYYHFISKITTKLCKFLKTKVSELLIFGGLFMLLIVYTYYLYGGITIGDQWYHQGRALVFLSGSFREAALSQAEAIYPPFQSALLATLTALSGVPLVNSYASIAFLNMMPIFAFYYFFSRWVPTNMRRAAPLACSLFTISSGFGWIYLLSTVTTNPIISSQASLETLRNLGRLDFVTPSNFIIPTGPDFSTGLIYIVLPAGFVLLAILRTNINTKFANILVVTALSVLGIITQPEFYIFILIASVSLLIFKMKARNYAFLGFLFSFCIVYLLDITAPGNYFTSIKILGFPLLFLSVLFVVISWTIYLTGGYVRKVLEPRLIFLKMLLKLRYHDSRFKVRTAVIIISVVAYLYLLSFIVLSQFSIETIQPPAFINTIPWYLYPMRMGLAGLLGLAFILSYLFKKFEKHVFVFGIITVVSFVTGPYYDEYRFTKYMMVGLIGFASLMIYNILNQRFKNKPLGNTVLLSIIIMFSGISSFIFIGYNSLILQTEDYTNTMSRRHFPSMSELQLYETLLDKIDVPSTKYNVISFPNEYIRVEDGIMWKIQAFSGLPYDKLRQSPLTLNTSTLDALYYHLAYSDAKYILIPKDSIEAGRQIAEPTRFLLDHFKRIYDDNKYIIIEVPLLVPPSTYSKTEVGLMYNQTDHFASPKVSELLLQYDNKTFDFKGKNEKSVTVQKGNQSKGLNLLGSKMDKGFTIWSKTIVPEKRLNHIEVTFRIASENENKSNDVRLNWLESNKQYYAQFSKNGLELYQKSLNNQDKKLLVKSTGIEKKEMIWYTLKIESLDDSINIYINNVLKIQATRDMDNSNEGISKVGLTSFYNDVEFTPIKLGVIGGNPQKMYDNTKYYDYYYPLSLLALSKARYDVFTNDDFSIFSKDVVVTSDTLKFDNVSFNRYLDYAHAGGTWIVMNSHNNFSEISGQLFSLKSNESQTEAFTNIAGNKNQPFLINVPGLVKRVDMVPDPDIHVIASYRDNNNETIAPFILERIFPSGGKILLISSSGYFNTISNSPTQYFSTLSNISNLLPIDLGKGTISQNTSLPLKGFIGMMNISGEITLKSSSLSLPNEGSYPYLLNTSRITIFNNTDDPPIPLDNVSIKSLKIIGDYEVTINLKGDLQLPGMLSHHDYINMRLPDDSNITVFLSPKRHSYMEIVTQNHSVTKSIKVNNGSKIELDKIRGEPPLKSVPVILKSPEMEVYGHLYNNGANLYGNIASNGKLIKANAVDLEGKLEANFDFVDSYNEPYLNGSRTHYITYLQSLTLDGTLHEDKEHLKLPGDMHYKAKEAGQVIPLETVLSSSSNILVLITLSIIAIIAIWLINKLHLY